jgi:hypothetical protein
MHSRSKLDHEEEEEEERKQPNPLASPFSIHH